MPSFSIPSGRPLINFGPDGAAFWGTWENFQFLPGETEHSGWSRVSETILPSQPGNEQEIVPSTRLVWKLKGGWKGEHILNPWHACFSPNINIHFPTTGGSVVKNPPVNVGDAGSIHGWGRSPGEGNGNPLQYSCTKIRLYLRMCGIQKYAFLSFRENRKAGCQKSVFLTQGITGVLKYALHSSAILFWQKKLRLQNTSNLDTPA